MSTSAGRTSVGPRVGTDPRISRRRRAVAREQRRRLFFRAAVVVSLAVFAWTAFWSPLLRVDRVRVWGASHTGRQAVARAAGLDRSDNLLLVSPGAIAERVESLPWVRSAEVDRILPDTVRVKLRERKARLVLAVGSQQWLLDGRGRVLGRGTGARAMPVLAGAPLESLEEGERLSDGAARSALAAYRSLPPRLRHAVRAMFAPSPERIGFALAGGMQVRYGAAERMPAKAAVLGALLRRLRVEGRTAAYVDVRVPTRPAVSDLPAGTRPGALGAP